MALAIRQQVQSPSDYADHVLTLGAGTQVGDLIVLVQCNAWYEAANLLTPTGTAVSSWTLRHTMDGGTNDTHAKVWTGLVTTGGASTVDVNSTTTDDERFSSVWVISGGAAYADAQSTDSDVDSTNFIAPSVTPAAGSTDNILMCAWGHSANSTVTLTVPGSMTGYTQVDFGAICSFRAASEVYTSSSATGTRTATGNAARMPFGVSVIVSPGGAIDPPVPKPAPVSDRGTVANTTAATTSSVTLTSPTTIAVGNYLVARVAVDNSGTNGAAPGCTVTDPRSNTWTVLGPALADPGAAAAGATAYLCYAKVATAYQAADALTFNWGGISTTAKAVVVEEWTNIDPDNPVAVTAVTNDSGAAASTTAVTVSRTPTQLNQVVYTCLATEGIAGDSITYDSDTTNGTWQTLTRLASANATAASNQCVAGQYKQITATGAQSWDATITSRDWAAIAVVWAAPYTLPPSEVITEAARVRAHYW